MIRELRPDERENDFVQTRLELIAKRADEDARLKRIAQRIEEACEFGILSQAARVSALYRIAGLSAWQGPCLWDLFGLLVLGVIQTEALKVGAAIEAEALADLMAIAGSNGMDPPIVLSMFEGLQ